MTPCPSRSPRWIPLALCAVVLASCGPTSRRNLASIPQRSITFDDMCDLQEYFDQRRAAGATPPRVVDEQSTETEAREPDEHGRMQRVMIGEGTYVVSDRPARRRLHRLVIDEYTRVPRLRMGGRGGNVRLRVHWWASGQMRRLRPDHEIELATDEGATTLPFNPCIGEFLFGDEAYAMRRHVLDSDLARARGEIPALANTNGGVEAESSGGAGATSSGDAGAAASAPPAATPAGTMDAGVTAASRPDAAFGGGG